METEITYQTFKVILSIMIAFIASYAALFLFTRFRNHTTISWTKWLSAILMGLAICGMHYTGMSATTFQTTEDMNISRIRLIYFYRLV
ncbi:MHYT domain-containing protein [Gracilibacillus kekensis]|uniref:MHYT domain-containing protein n=1 Tax=Gracilibacillus kekensis TaxID=1027249 RepID=UPI002689B021